MPKISTNTILKIKEIFLEWSLRTDLNCYTKIFIYRDRPLVGLIWLFILLVSSGITFWLISNSILEYFNYSIVSQIGIVYETKSVFPIVTICEKHPFTTRQAEELFEEVAQKYNISSNDSRVLNYAKLFVTTPNYSDEKKKSYGLNLNQFKFCYFAGEPCDMKKDIKWIWMYSYGNCWQFNSGQNLKETYNGIDFGLEIAVGLENQNRYISQEMFSQGLLVIINNNSFYPFYTEKSQVFVEIGKETYIGVKRTFNYKMPRPYSKCIDFTNYKSDLYDFIRSNRTYRQSDCFRLCRQKLCIEKCGCNAVNDYNLNYINPNIRYCTGDDLGCIDRQYYNFSRKECERNSCPLECDSIEYDLKLSSLTYPEEKSTVGLIVFYPALEYTFIRESPQMTELGLFANIGGTLGLFISASIFTLFEIIEILVLVFQALFF